MTPITLRLQHNPRVVFSVRALFGRSAIFYCRSDGSGKKCVRDVRACLLIQFIRSRTLFSVRFSHHHLPTIFNTYYFIIPINLIVFFPLLFAGKRWSRSENKSLFSSSAARVSVCATESIRRRREEVDW